MTDLYQSDPAKLSNEELESLSAELEEAYCSTNDDGDSWWHDSQAEDRYHKLRAEIWDREWNALTPEQREERQKFLSIELRMLSANLRLHGVQREFAAEFATSNRKIGDTLTIQRPKRLQGVA